MLSSSNGGGDMIYPYTLTLNNQDESLVGTSIDKTSGATDIGSVFGNAQQQILFSQVFLCGFHIPLPFFNITYMCASHSSLADDDSRSKQEATTKYREKVQQNMLYEIQQKLKLNVKKLSV